MTVAPASASVKVGATTTLTFTVKPDGASDKAISVHSTDPQTATVTLNGFVTGSVRFYCKGQRGGCSHFYTGR
ncbi:Ig-like domain-containing protein, partial [Bacillus sp. B-TM1]